MHLSRAEEGDVTGSSRTGLRSPQVQRVAALFALARIPAAAIWLSILLDVSAASGSYGRAGGAVAAYGIGVALLAPFVGRAADRLGPRLVLLSCAAVQLPALLLLAALSDTAGLTLLVPAALAGAAQPPLTPCMRASWKVLVPDGSERKKCLAFDAVLGEVIDLASPLIAVALNIAAGDSGSLPYVAVAAALTIIGFALAVPRGARPVVAAEQRSRAVTRPVMAVLVVIFGLTCALGAVEVGAVAAADAAGHRGWAAMLLAVFALTSIVGGVLHARRPSSSRATTELSLLLLLLALGLTGAALAAQNVFVAGALLGLAGLAVAPLVTVLLGLVETVAKPGCETLTFTLATTANFIGVAAGSALAGLAVDLPADRVGLLAGRGLLTGALLALVSLALVWAVSGYVPSTVSDPVTAAHDPVPGQVEALLAELEELWRQTAEVGRRNDELARQLAERPRLLSRTG